MNLDKVKKMNIIYIVLFVVLNLFNTYFATAQLLNRYITPVTRTFFGEVTAIIGNLSVLLFLLIITFKIFKKDRSRFRALLYITLFLNVFIFLLNIYSMFYMTTFTIHSLDIFKNPSEGVGQGIVGESLLQLIIYYRILIFIPFITLLVLFIIYKKESLGVPITTKISFKKYLTGFLSSFMLFVLASLSYMVQITEAEFHINAISSTRGIQNFGLYPYYLTELVGINFNYISKDKLGIHSTQELEAEFDFYNKNVSSYENFIDGKTYSNNLLIKDSILTEDSLEGYSKNDSLNGIFKDKNLMLIHLESLNYFLFEVPELREKFTFLNELFEESVVFENYYTSVGMGVSSDAEFSTLTGLYPNGYSTFYRDYEKGNYTLDTLPKLFNNKNYKTKSYHGDFERFYNRDNAYVDLIGFTEEYYSIEKFAKDAGYDDAVKYMRTRNKGVEYNGLTLTSPWPSEFEMNDVIYEDQLKMGDEKYMYYPLYLTMHTPYLFNPYEAPTYNIKDYNLLKPITKRYVEHIPYIDDLIKSHFIDPVTNESRIDSNTVYVFYSDHGSGLKNRDLNILYGKELSSLEERMKLLQTIAFIYAPSNEIKEGSSINKGLIKGRQKLTRGHVDLYRTIGELFGLFNDQNFFFGTNVLSKEPGFVIDNRIQDLVIDNINDLGNPFYISLRNKKNYFPDVTINNQTYVLNKIQKFKKLSDLLLIDDTVYIEYKETLMNWD